MAEGYCKALKIACSRRGEVTSGVLAERRSEYKAMKK